MSGLYLGIDTSNYKTSVAVTDSSNDTVYEKSVYLDVPAGKRGLRQSEAFFGHSNRLPDYIEELSSAADLKAVRAIGVSTRPRRVEGSYMPCFLAGINSARILSSALNVPVYEFSHQEGHAAAVIEDPSCISDNDTSAGNDLFFHLSGGTTEFLKCHKDDLGYEMEIVGGTKDISIGQLIDRAGVKMGMPFPSGSYMDTIASSFTGSKSGYLPRIRIEDGYFNLSGAETKTLRTIEQIHNNEFDAVIAELFTAIADLLYGSASALCARYDADRVFMAGGVASSSCIRKLIYRKVQNNNFSPDIVFGKPELSGDNAVGIARLARRIQENQ